MTVTATFGSISNRKANESAEKNDGLETRWGEKEKEFNLSQGKTGGWERPEREDYIYIEMEEKRFH